MFGWVGSLLEGRLQEDVAKANAKIAEEEARAQGMAIDAERERMADEQRKLKAKQRMSVASRGGMMAGTDLLTLVNEAKEMQMDQLEMVRQRDLAEISGFNRAQMMRWEGKMAKRASRWTAAGQLAGDVFNVATTGMGMM